MYFCLLVKWNSRECVWNKKKPSNGCQLTKSRYIDFTWRIDWIWGFDITDTIASWFEDIVLRAFGRLLGISCRIRTSFAKKKKISLFPNWASVIMSWRNGRRALGFRTEHLSFATPLTLPRKKNPRTSLYLYKTTTALFWTSIFDQETFSFLSYQSCKLWTVASPFRGIRLGV